ncbi:DUF6204 family protein [Streptomyces goshikiensis]|uniref:DUF6204 family protein n=1 Tax=Streptomyces goshikiensis TaxID=1942 RepID=UPI003329F2F8
MGRAPRRRAGGRGLGRDRDRDRDRGSDRDGDRGRGRNRRLSVSPAGPRGGAEEDLLDATARAELAAEEWLTARGYGFKQLRSTAQDLSQAPLGKRGRREAARADG